MNKKKLLIYVGIIVVLLVVLGIMGFMFIKSNDSTNSNAGLTNNNASASQNAEQSESSVSANDKRGEVSYSDYNAQINLSSMTSNGSGVTISNNTVKITTKGTYYITGTSNNGNIVVEAGDDDNVVLVFDNVNLTSQNTACVNGVNAKNIYINVKEGTINTFTDSSKYTVFTENEEPDATIFSKTDLLINGKGTLIVNANYQDAIVSKDDLVITNATIKVTSNDDGIRGKDSVDIKDATIEVSSKQDAIKASNDEDTSKGYVIIEGASITISAGDDGIHAETELKINSGNINITKSTEGLEGKIVEINDGNINVVSSDDGINATDGSTSSQAGPMMQGNSNSSSAQIIINGGKIYVNAEGDGLDANGSIFQNGGEVTVVGTTQNGNGALDYDGAFNVTGGNLVIYGATGMWQNPSTSSTQYSICFSQNGKTGDKIELKDSSENTLSSFTAEKNYGAVLISNPNLKNGETYSLYVNGSQVSSQQITSIVTSNVQGGGMNGGMMGGQQGGMRQNNMQAGGMRQNGQQNF